MVISHDTELLAAVVNKVWFLDAMRGEVDVYNMDWQRYLEARATDEKRRRRERANAEKKASVLHTQAAKMGAKATKAVAAQEHGAPRRPAAGRRWSRRRQADKVARIRFPEPAPCGTHPAHRGGAVARPTARWRCSPASTSPIDRGAKVVVLGPQRRRQDHAAAAARPARRTPDAGEVRAGPRAAHRATTRRSTTRSTMDATVWENVRHAAPDTPEQQLRTLLGSFMFSGEQLDQPAGTLSGGEKTRLALAGLVSSAANVLLLDEPTNNLDPASREQVLDALRRFAGAVVLVTHDPGAVRGAAPGQGDRAARRHRGPLVRRLPRTRPAGLIGRSRRHRSHPIGTGARVLVDHSVSDGGRARMIDSLE